MKTSNLISAADGKPNNKEMLNKIADFPAVNVSESKNNLQIILEIPGYTHDEISVYVMNSRIYVTGSRDEQVNKKTFINTERITSFRWVYDLKIPFTKKDLEINLENGFLSITILKGEKKMLQSKQIPVIENYMEDNLYFPRANVVETENHIEMSLEIPGYKSEDVSIEINESSLRINGKRTMQLYNKEELYHRIEIPFRNSFLRRFELPENVNRSQASWNVKNGVLFVYLPKLKTIRKEEVARETMLS